MRLSPTKITQYAERLVDVLADTDGILFEADDADLRVAITDIMTDELMQEERLDSELHELLQSKLRFEISMGRVNYDELFRKAKNQEVRKRGIII
ncbi:MAG: hypothetical protein RLY87_943 [Chloroflexota bacterium]